MLDRTLRRAFEVAGVMSLILAGPAQAAEQACALDRGGDAGVVRVAFDERGGALHAIAFYFERSVGGSAHECSIGSRRGDGFSRWAHDTSATYARIEHPESGLLLLIARRDAGGWLLSSSAAGGELARCGTFEIPATMIVTKRPDGRCVARLPEEG